LSAYRCTAYKKALGALGRRITEISIEDAATRESFIELRDERHQTNRVWRSMAERADADWRVSVATEMC
jgi:hypothetical protein